jgi:hypothetical protein
MKRYIAAVSFAVFAVPAFAAGLPYEQTEVDRALPNVPERTVRADPAPRFAAPYEQNAVDRARPSFEPRRTQFAAAAGSTRSDAGTGLEPSTESVWANDHNFIAPAQ